MISTKKLSYIPLFAFLIAGFLPVQTSAHVGIVSAPTSCGVLDSVDLKTHTTNQISNRTSISNSTTDRDMFSSKTNSTSTPWTRSSSVWSNKVSPIDFTGVAAYVYNSSNPTYFPSSRIGTLISPRHFLSATHWPPNPGEQLSFIDASGNQVIRTVVAHQSIGNDITVGVLNADVPDTITYYPLIASTTLASNLQKVENEILQTPIVAFNQTPRLVVRNLSTLNHNNDSNDIVNYKYTSGAFAAFSQDVIGGDSGSPNFVLIQGKPVLLSAYHYVSGGPNYGAYIPQINAAMTSLGGGYQVTEYDTSCFTAYTLNHAPAIASQTTATTTVHQDSSTVVKTYTATDIDGDSVQYTLGALNSASNPSLVLQAGDYFTINNSGELRQIADLDPSTMGHTVTLSVNAVDTNLHPATSTTLTSIAIDRLELVSMSAADSAVELHFDKTIATTSVPSTTDFVVLVDSVQRGVTAVNVFGDRVVLTLASAVSVGQSIRLTYTPGVNKITDYPSLAKAEALDSVAVPNSVSGSEDASFITGSGFTVMSGQNDAVWDAFVDLDGKILVIPRHNEFTNRLSYSGTTTTPSLIRLLPNGSIDTTFSLEDIPEFFSISHISQQADKKYIISTPGYDYINFGGDYTGVYRINNNGTRDNTFLAADGGWNANCSEGGLSAVQSDGKIITIASCPAFYGAQPSGYSIARLNSSGSYDSSFNPGTGFGTGVALVFNKMIIQPDQKILIAGRFNSYNGTSRWGVLRLNSNGSLDTSFTNALPYASTTPVYDLELLSDGRMYVSIGLSSGTQPSVFRLLSDGSVDPTFSVKNISVPSSTPVVVDISVDSSEDKLVIAGRFETYDGYTANGIARVHANGEYDSTFVSGAGIGSSLTNVIFDLARLPNQTLVAVGRFPTYNGVTKNGIVGILTETSADTTNPTVTNVTSSTPNGTYGVGQTIPIQVTFSESVQVTGVPQLVLQAGSDRTISYVSGSGSSTLTFTYVVQSGDTTTDLSYVHTGSLTLNGGTIKDAAGNNAIRDLPVPGVVNSLSSNKQIVIDAVAPVIASAQVSGNTIVLVFDKDLATTSIPATNSFIVQANSIVGYSSVTAVQVDEYRKVILTLADAVLSSHSVYLSYSVPGSAPLSGLYSNTIASWNLVSLVNETPASTPVVLPVVTSSGGGGGGGGGGVYIQPVVISTPTVAEKVLTVFNLQQFLNANGYVVATKGPGSPGKETNFLGPATRKALVRYQKVVGLPATGIFDSATRAKISMFTKLQNGTATTTPAICSIGTAVTRPIKFGASNDANQVKLLEQFLNTYAGFTLPVDGRYDRRDRDAVIVWQESHAASVLTPWGLKKGTGYVFTTSLKKMQEIVGVCK